eukprot:11189212-Lingulodinium_polyedra.AAC.1
MRVATAVSSGCRAYLKAPMSAPSWSWGALPRKSPGRPVEEGRPSLPSPAGPEPSMTSMGLPSNMVGSPAT